MTALGDTRLIDSKTIGFLCSRTTSSMAILSCLDWAVEIAKDESACVVSTFHSPLEKEALRFLLQGKCKIIMVLGRRLYRTIPQEIQKAIDEGRLQIISLTNQGMITKASALLCNKYIAENSDEIVFGFISEGSHLEDVLLFVKQSGKTYKVLANIETHNPALQ